MHCPKCGQQQISNETRFCSRCGLLLTGVADLIANSGVVAPTTTGLTGTPDSPRRKGIKQGAFLFMLTFLVVPLLIIFSISLNLEPFLPLGALFLLGVGGILRIVYSLMFLPGTSPNVAFGLPNALPGGRMTNAALPASDAPPASAYVSPMAGSWRDTNDLQKEPNSVTDNTTKLLHSDEQ
jgi:hypothetical protein